MATQAHCAYCFESLNAAFERRQPPSLRQVEESWQRYRASTEPEVGADIDFDEDDDDEAAKLAETDARTQANVSPRPAAISRLLNHDTSSAASSSSSLPSIRSATSSNEASENSSGISTPASSQAPSISSRLSAFSRRKKSGTSADQSFPLFVTWNTISRIARGGEYGKTLRGCIGTFAPQVLESGLRSYALTSAFEDDRFSPIPASHLPRLGVQVTLLTDFSTPSSDPMAWTLGQHGIRINFAYRGARLGSTYLPDVASEQGWTKDETIASLMRKAGWSGSDWRKAWQDGKGTLVTYEGKQASLSYDEWRWWKGWVNSKDLEGRLPN